MALELVNLAQVGALPPVAGAAGREAPERDRIKNANTESVADRVLKSRRHVGSTLRRRAGGRRAGVLRRPSGRRPPQQVFKRRM